MALPCISKMCKCCLIWFAALTIPCVSQSTDSKNAMYVEAFGPGLFYSINYERFISTDFTVRGGVSIFPMNGETSQSTFIIAPIMCNYLFGNGNSKLEIGGGIDLVTINGEEYGDLSRYESTFSETSILLVGSFGYRYQPSDGGFHFRIVATPMLSPYNGYFIPLFGCSAGTCF